MNLLAMLFETLEGVLFGLCPALVGEENTAYGSFRALFHKAVEFFP